MTDTSLIKQIGKIIDIKLDTKLKPIKKQLGSIDKGFGGVEKGLNGVETRLDGVDKRLNSVETRLDSVETKVELLGKKVEQSNQELKRVIAQSQEETIDAISELVQTGHNMHEKRISNIEKHLHLS